MSFVRAVEHDRGQPSTHQKRDAVIVGGALELLRMVMLEDVLRAKVVTLLAEE